MNINKAPAPVKKERIPEEIKLLDCQPGDWRTLVEEITLEGKHNKETQEFVEGSIAIPKGAQINVLGKQEYFGGGVREDGNVQIKISNPPEQSFYIWASPANLQDKIIKVESR